jgi:hypothetical protein
MIAAMNELLLGPEQTLVLIDFRRIWCGYHIWCALDNLTPISARICILDAYDKFD